MAEAPRLPKRATNIAVDEELLERARRLGLNVSQVLESALARAIQEREAAAWLKRNRAALEGYNAQMEKQGVFSEGVRSF